MPQLDFPWEREAMRKDRQPVMPDGLSLSEQAAFQAVSCLYSRYYLGKIEKDAASREKKLIKRALKDSQKVEAHAKSLMEHYIEVTRKTEIYRAAYRKAESQEELIEAANRLVEAIDNVPCIKSLDELPAGGN